VTRAELATWLDERTPDVPPVLRQHLNAFIDSGRRGEAMPEHLARLGRAALERVIARGQGGRELALDLLAADAFVTYAFEAQALVDVSGLAQLATHVAEQEARAAR
jgi:hypothetical protein